MMISAFEALGILTKMSKSIPLGTGLCVKCQDVIIYASRGFVLDSVMKRRPLEAGEFGIVECAIC